MQYSNFCDTRKDFYNFLQWISKAFCFQKFWDTLEYSFLKFILNMVGEVYFFPALNGLIIEHSKCKNYASKNIHVRN